jgi:hypothetical protein
VSGVGTPNFGELKGKRMSLAKGRLYKNESHIKLSKARKNGALVILTRSSILHNCLLGQSQTPPVQFTKSGGYDTTSTVLEPYRLSKMG